MGKVIEFRPLNKLTFDQLYEKASKIDDCPDSYDRAIELYKEALKINFDHYLSMLNIGNIFYKKNNLLEACSWYTKALLYNSKCKEAWYNLGLCAYNENNYTMSIAFFEKVIEIDYNFSESYFFLGSSFFELGKKGSAKFYLDRYLELNNNGDLAENAKEILRKI